MWTVPYSGPDNVEAVGGDPSRPGYERHRVRAALFRTAVSTCVSVAIRPPSPVVAAPILEEYIRVLAYPKFTLTRAEIHGLIEEELLPFVETITATPVVIPTLRDPDDAHFIACAMAAGVRWLVSGDDDLLSLHRMKSVEILSVAAFLPHLKANR